MADYFWATFHCIIFQTIRTLHLFFKLNILTRSVPRLSSSPEHLNTSCHLRSAKWWDKQPPAPGQEKVAVGSWVEGTGGEGPLFAAAIHEVISAVSWSCTLKFIWIFETLQCEIKEDVPEPKGINIRNNGYYGRKKADFLTVEFILWRSLYSTFEDSKH